jgi:hypothetical protein
MVNYENKDDEVNDKEEKLKNLMRKSKKPEYEVYDNFIKEIKDLFLDKYDLYLKSIRLELCKINNELYLIDVDKMVFDKYNNKDPKMNFEKIISCFKEKHVDKNLKLTKETPNLMEINDLIETMKNVYFDKVIDKCGVPQYLKPPEKDPRADEAFKILKENCPYKFSELLSDEIDKKTFMRYCSNKIIK